MNAHERVSRKIQELALNYSSYDPERIRKGKFFPNPALIPVGKFPIHFKYIPDVWARRKGRAGVGGRYDIYEVWYSEGIEKAFHEILRVAFTPDVEYYSVVCVNEGKDGWNKKLAASYVRAVLENLKEPRITYEKNVMLAEVDKATVDNDRKLHSALSRQLEF
jgi:hypothetical protein